MVIDVSDYGSMIFKGGDIPYFNARGFIIIFPENEGYIDPVTIEDGASSTATAIEQQRRVFRNPRGSEYYWAIFENSTNEYSFYNSSNGITWNFHYDFNPATSEKSCPIEIWEDSTNNRLIIYMLFTSSNDQTLYFQMLGLNDTYSGIYEVQSEQTIATATDDGIFNPNIKLDDDGYLWVSWADEFTNKGKQRNQLRVTRTTTTYPTSAPAWEAIVNIYGENGSPEYGDGLPCGINFIKSELNRVTATHNISVVFSAYDSDVGAKLLGIGLTAPLGAITEDNLVTIDGAIPSAMIHSSVVETGSDSDVFILHMDFQAIVDLSKWDISADSSSAYGEIYDGGVNGATSLSLSINETLSPDKLFCFWANSTNGSFWIDSTDVDSFSLDGIFEISGEVQALDHFSSSGVDLDGEIYLIYTMANNTVRFYNLIPPFYPSDPDFLYGAGFNGSVNGFVELYWNQTVSAFTDFEVHNSSDGIAFVFLDNVSDPWYNHTGLTNMTYHFYRVRSRYFMAEFDQYFNSSWSNIDLERVFFNRTVSGGGVPGAGGSGAIGFIMLSLIFIPVGLLLVWGKRR
jgi:hypothetical protein